MEQPNLSLIKEISGNDLAFENSILEIIKKEFPVEVSLFIKNFQEKKFIEASNNVHKIKHKISLLGLEKGLETASAYEMALKEGDTKLHNIFLEIIDKIHVYLSE
mmetsp:Transcript_32020/g.37335  ORF Transcript_32020/g.37335 Transcript_32020/m.37335 type:complete len:105 (+) Transcript_32020:520-834(+)